jgi:hypothetical protein
MFTSNDIFFKNKYNPIIFITIINYEYINIILNKLYLLNYTSLIVNMDISLLKL